MAQTSASFGDGIPDAWKVIAFMKFALLSRKQTPALNDLLSEKVAASRLHLK